MLWRQLFIMLSTETCLQVRDHRMALDRRHGVQWKTCFLFDFLYILLNLYCNYLIFTLLCTVFYTKFPNSERSPSCRANWSRWKIWIFQIEFFNLKKWCVRCPGKLQKHCHHAHRARNRLPDFFVYYISWSGRDLPAPRVLVPEWYQGS